MLGSFGMFDSDDEKAQQREPNTIYDRCTEANIPANDARIQSIYAPHELETNLFDFPDNLTDSGPEKSVDSTYGSEESDRDFSCSDRASLESESPTSLRVQLAEQIPQFQGCCPGCHHGSSQPLANPGGSFIRTIELADLQKRPCPNVLSSPRLPDAQTAWPKQWSATDRRQLFCGIINEHPIPPAVLVAGEDEIFIPPDVIFDTDSVSAFISSLAVAR